MWSTCPMITHPTVYVPNYIGVENTNLHKWGAIQAVFTTSIYPDTTDEVKSMARGAVKMFENFDRDLDMLALMGDPALISLCVMALSKKLRMNKIIVLKYDRHLGAYYPVTLELP